jgi:predicted TIM-barrel fold metal-dependent hydrolase
MTPDLPLSQFRPVPKLVVPETRLPGPCRPFIDAHNHLGTFGGGWDQRDPAALFDWLQQAGVVHYVDLDGGWGEDVLDDRLRRFKAQAPDRYRVFGGVDWSRWADEGHAFADRAAARLRAQAARGAEGLKIWKPFGLTVTDDAGALARIDDPRLDPIWATAAELGLPVMIHIADPVAFFDPLTPENERWDELHAHPDWQFPSPPFPAFGTLIEAFARLVRRHPATTFIGAHVGCHAENLGWVSTLLDACPNLMVDISARIAELGRQPFSACRFFQRHADRILFGTDAGPDLATYATYARFLETEDEYFPYSPDGIPGQGRWMIYGLNLGRDILDKVYHDNAARLFGLHPPPSGKDLP